MEVFYVRQRFFLKPNAEYLMTQCIPAQHQESELITQKQVLRHIIRILFSQTMIIPCTMQSNLNLRQQDRITE